MSGPWRVEYVEHCMTEGMGCEVDEDGRERWPKWRGRTHHRTWIAADFHRRFRERYYTLGSFWMTTEILHRDGRDHRRRVEASERAIEPVWKVVYFVRSRWDGLRHGLDRDRRC